MRLDPYPLEGRFVRLEPFRAELKEPLRRALDVDPDSWALQAISGQGEHFDGWWQMLCEDMVRGTRIAYAVRRIADAKLVGTTSFLNIRAKDDGVEIGSTFFRPEARSGVVNPDAKRLMLAAAFKAGAMRVELVTDARNLRSQAAIAKLGATREGVLRKHKLTFTGHQRDTVVFSITDEEWPQVRERLDTRLDALAAERVPA